MVAKLIDATHSCFCIHSTRTSCTLSLNSILVSIQCFRVRHCMIKLYIKCITSQWHQCQSCGMRVSTLRKKEKEEEDTLWMTKWERRMKKVIMNRLIVNLLFNMVILKIQIQWGNHNIINRGMKSWQKLLLRLIYSPTNTCPIQLCTQLESTEIVSAKNCLACGFSMRYGMLL